MSARWGLPTSQINFPSYPLTNHACAPDPDTHVTPARPCTADAPVRVIADPSIAIEVRMNAPPAAARCPAAFPVPSHPLPPPSSPEEDEESDELELDDCPRRDSLSPFFSTLPHSLVSDRVFTLLARLWIL